MTEDIDLPGRPTRTWWAFDFVTFDKIWIAAHSINDWCMTKKGKPGWTAVGTFFQTMAHSLVRLKPAQGLHKALELCCGAPARLKMPGSDHGTARTSYISQEIYQEEAKLTVRTRTCDRRMYQT